MTDLLPPVTQATTTDIGTVAHLIAEAFHSLDAARWLVPDAEQRHAAMAGQFGILIEHALTFGHVHLLADATAAAVWLHNTRPIPPPPEYDQRLARACGVYVDRFRTLDQLFETHHPAEPHHYLAMLAVAPAQQGTGRGTVLLRHHHALLDQQGLPAYLEAAGIRSTSLYRREGYHRYNPPFTLAGTAHFFPMWRHPTRHSATIPEPDSLGVA